MNPHPASRPEPADELAPLRLLAGGLAARLGLDLGDRRVVSRLLHDDGADPELRTMLTLLYRLENGTAEELGCSGLHELWRRRDEMLARHAASIGHAAAGPGAGR